VFAASNTAIKAARIFPDLLQFSRRMPSALSHPSHTRCESDFAPGFPPPSPLLWKLIHARITSFKQIGNVVSVASSRTSQQFARVYNFFLVFCNSPYFTFFFHFLRPSFLPLFIFSLIFLFLFDLFQAPRF